MENIWPKVSLFLILSSHAESERSYTERESERERVVIQRERVVTQCESSYTE